jgi:two-component SAPR family response regulator
VFSDVVMPGMNGIELAKEVKRLYPGLPIVLTSGYSHVLADTGVKGFELLHKPIPSTNYRASCARGRRWERPGGALG